MGEHWIYKNADVLIFLKEGDIGYLKDRKWTTEQGGKINLNKCYYINNGVDIERFNDQANNFILSDSDLKDNIFNVMYTGAIRSINNVENIIDTAKILKKHDDIRFFIYGAGNQLQRLKERVINEELTNVKIKGHIKKKYIPYILSKSSVNLLNYSQNKYNWSRGNSSNKLFEYMASGKPIISTVKMGYSLLKEYDCGISLEKGTPEELAKAILYFHRMPKERYIEMSNNAKSGAKEFDYRLLTKKLMSVLESQLV